MTPISWLNVSKAISWYESLGYTYIEMPWTASEKAVLATLPKDKFPCCVVEESAQGIREGVGGAKYLLGSAEQGFIDMMRQGRLPGGYYVAATPCFRSDVVDELHQKAFFKVELIRCQDVRKRDILEMVEEARGFMCSLLPEEGHVLEPRVISEKPRAYQTDLELNGIEVGSYGIRQMAEAVVGGMTTNGGPISWVYGTGLAEPRFSIAKGKVR